MILAIIGLVAMGFILGFVSRNTDKTCGMHWDYDVKSSKIADLELRVFILERENERSNFLFKSMEAKKRCFEEHYAAHCQWCSKTFYSRDFKDKDVAELLSKITLSSEEIAKKLGFDIPS